MLIFMTLHANQSSVKEIVPFFDVRWTAMAYHGSGNREGAVRSLVDTLWNAVWGENVNMMDGTNYILANPGGDPGEAQPASQPGGPAGPILRPTRGLEGLQCPLPQQYHPREAARRMGCDLRSRFPFPCQTGFSKPCHNLIIFLYVLVDGRHFSARSSPTPLRLAQTVS